MIDPLLRQMIKTVAILKTESELAATPEALSRVERLASLVYVQAAEARAVLLSPKRLDSWADDYEVSPKGGLLH